MSDDQVVLYLYLTHQMWKQQRHNWKTQLIRAGEPSVGYVVLLSARCGSCHTKPSFKELLIN